MQLINTDGMAFIGPGSEWFWTALTGIVLAGTFIAIYRQLQMQGHARAVEQLAEFQRVLDSEATRRRIVDLLVALRDHKDDPTDLPPEATWWIAGYWERLATAARTGHIDTKFMWQTDSASAQIVWAWLAPWATKSRPTARFGSRFLGDLEWLAGRMAELDHRAGVPPLTAEWVASQTDNFITRHREAVRVAQALRTVIVAPPDTVTIAPPTVAPGPVE